MCSRCNGPFSPCCTGVSVRTFCHRRKRQSFCTVSKGTLSYVVHIPMVHIRYYIRKWWHGIITMSHIHLYHPNTALFWRKLKWISLSSIAVQKIQIDACRHATTPPLLSLISSLSPLHTYSASGHSSLHIGQSSSNFRIYLPRAWICSLSLSRIWLPGNDWEDDFPNCLRCFIYFRRARTGEIAGSNRYWWAQRTRWTTSSKCSCGRGSKSWHCSFISTWHANMRDRPAWQPRRKISPNLIHLVYPPSLMTGRLQERAENCLCMAVILLMRTAEYVCCEGWTSLAIAKRTCIHVSMRFTNIVVSLVRIRNRGINVSGSDSSRNQVMVCMCRGCVAKLKHL